MSQSVSCSCLSALRQKVTSHFYTQNPITRIALTAFSWAVAFYAMPAHPIIAAVLVVFGILRWIPPATPGAAPKVQREGELEPKSPSASDADVSSTEDSSAAPEPQPIVASAAVVEMAAAPVSAEVVAVAPVSVEMAAVAPVSAEMAAVASVSEETKTPLRAPTPVAQEPTASAPVASESTAPTAEAAPVKAAPAEEKREKTGTGKKPRRRGQTFAKIAAGGGKRPEAFGPQPTKTSGT